MLNMKYLHYFRVLAETEHFGNAAELLGIAQSSLSYAMENLENELGLTLFEKSGRNVRLTGQGAEYLRYVNQAISLLERGRERTRVLADTRLRVGFVSSVREEVFGSIARFRKDLPDVRITAYEGITHQLLELLAREKLDLVLASYPGEDGDFVSIPWRIQQLVVVSAEELPEAEIRIEDAAQHPMVLHTPDSGMRRVVDGLFAEKGLSPQCAAEASEDSGVLALVRLGCGIAVMTDSLEVRSAGLYVAPLPGDSTVRRIYLSTRRGAGLSSPARAFAQILKSCP